MENQRRLTYHEQSSKEKWLTLIQTILRIIKTVQKTDPIKMKQLLTTLQTINDKDIEEMALKVCRESLGAK